MFSLLQADTMTVRGVADKSLARPGTKQAIATKLGIYSTCSQRSSIHFLARCPNICKPLNKIQNIVRQCRSPRQQWLPRRTKNCELSIVFFMSREQMVVRRGQIRKIEWVFKTLEAHVGQLLLGCKCPVSLGIFVQEQDGLVELPAGIFLKNVFNCISTY
jgi:hypothetical protein